MVCKRQIALALLLALLLSMAGCSARETPETQPKTPTWTPTPEPAITAEPAPLLRGVETDRKVVSLIFEGFTDSATMDAIADLLESRKVPAVFFLSGITANENPQVVRDLMTRGFAIGSYGMSGGKNLEEVTPYENTRRFTLAQREIEAACGPIACGVFGEPAGVPATAGLLKLSREGRLEKNATVVSIVTGNGLKDIDSAIQNAGEPVHCKNDLEAFEKAFF